MDPYTVYTKNRPVRIAFLVGSEAESRTIDDIIKFNRTLWGGRWNPIIFLENDALNDAAWKFLESYDADYILSPAALNPELEKRLINKLCPFRCAVFDENLYSSDIPHNLARVPLRIWRQYFEQYRYSGVSGLVNIETQSNTPEDIKEFLVRNFGVMGDIIPWPSPVNHCHDGVHTSHLKFSVLENLIDELKRVPISAHYVLPSQLCSSPVNVAEPEWFQEQDDFQIVVGSTSRDIAYVWNHALRLRTTQFAQTKVLWVSEPWFDSPQHLDAIVAFLKQRIHGTTRLASCSLAIERLNELSSRLERMSFRIDEPRLFKTQVLPIIRSIPSFWDVPNSRNAHQCHNENEMIKITEAALSEPGSSSQVYFADVSIPYDSTNLINIRGKDFWWQLPRRGALPNELQIFSHKWRVTATGSFSIQLSEKSVAHGFEDRVKLNLPTSQSLFYGVIHASCRPSLAETSQFVNFLTISDVGARLMAVRGLFENLYDAAHAFDSRYWRRMFKQLSGRSKSTAERNLVREYVSKHVKKREPQCTEAEHIDNLSERLIHILQEFSNPVIALNFQEFLLAARKEMDDWNLLRPDNQFEFSAPRLRNAMDYLIERGVLLLGLQPQCSNCGFSSWISADEISSQLACSGCGKKFTLPAEEKWSYRLNNILRTKGYELEPLFLTLASLLRESRHSFFYYPSAEFNLSYNEPWHEVDLICITDGSLVLGEVKSSYEEFNQGDFKSMGEVARVVRPERLIFTALYGTPTARNNRYLKDLADELRELAIDVNWYDLRISPDEPSPIFARPRGLD